ncbi:hypothetical protein QJS10_CPA08g00679 [Acorus calamus]|uniref:Uncharacterized protein n=1 Tax=Acorus calamus TaxID=4465 RepID=A0AAV9EDY4_ACOCL|nr:hypothetical protein QJS10_CPA08g00679 [Acorus calamus]
MSTSKPTNKRRGRVSEIVKPEKKKNDREDDDVDSDLPCEVKDIIAALQQIREKAQKDGQRKCEERIGRQNLLKTLSKSSKEFESSLKNESVKYQIAYEKFSKEKAAHLQTIKGKKEKTTLAELEKVCADKIAAAADSLKRKKQDDKSFSLLRKSLGSFLDNASDDDFMPDE